MIQKKKQSKTLTTCTKNLKTFKTCKKYTIINTHLINTDFFFS
eukprot:UN07738